MSASTASSAVDALDSALESLSVQLFAKDASAAKSATTALFSFAASNPRTMMRSLPKLEAGLADENYSKRSAIVQVLATLAEQLKDGVIVVDSVQSDLIDDDEVGDEVDSEGEESKAPDALEAAAKAASKASSAADLAAEHAEAKAHILALLLARKHDINSFTRIKTLQALLSLVRARAIQDPAAYVDTLRAAQDRLMDKTASVRKAAIQLLTGLMELNPFSPILDLHKFRLALANKAAAFKEAMANAPQQQGKKKIHAPLAIEEGEEQKEGADAEMDGEDEVKESEQPAHEQSLKALLSSAIQSDLALEKLRKELSLLFHAVSFLTTLSGQVLPLLAELLHSKTPSDQMECVHFFLVAKQFQLSSSGMANIDDAMDGADKKKQQPAKAANVSVDAACKKMLGLIWSRDQPVKDCVLDAFRSLYLDADLDSSSSSKAASASSLAKKAALVSVHNLITLVLSSSLSDLTSIEEIVTKLFFAGAIPPVLVETIWESFASETVEVSAQARAAFLTLINFMANASGKVMEKHAKELVQVGFSDASLASAPTLVRAACVSVQKWVAALKNAPTPAEAPVPLSAQTIETVHARLRIVLTQSSAPSVAVAGAWYSLAEQALATVFATSDAPERWSEGVLQVLAKDVFTPSSSAAADDSKDALGNAERLSRFLFLLAHTALRTLVHLETLEKDIKAIKAKIEAAKLVETENLPAAPVAAAVEEEGGKKKGGKSKKTKEPAAAAQAMATSIEDDLAANQAAEYELEQLREAAESELVELRTTVRAGLLTVWSPVVLHLVQNLHTYAAHPTLQTNAVLALCKLMSINVSYAEGGRDNLHLRLLFSTLKDARTPATIKSNIIVAVGDLFLRFPNSIEPFSEHMYVGLEKPRSAAASAIVKSNSDSSVSSSASTIVPAPAPSASAALPASSQQAQSDSISVRKSTLMVLTHLILNDMLKAKSPLAEIAKCTQLDSADADSEGSAAIAQMAQCFFVELNNKSGDKSDRGATIYNILPDILSRLSSDRSVAPAAFHEIFRFLLAFLTKDKQIENLVEKLLGRFELLTDAVGATEAEQEAAAAHGVKLARDLGYCLSQLSFSLVSLKKLQSLYRCYQSRLGDTEVFGYFAAVLAKARKSLGKDGNSAAGAAALSAAVAEGSASAKEKEASEMLSLCDELEQRFAGQHSKLAEEGATTNKARAARGRKGYGAKIAGEEAEKAAAAEAKAAAEAEAAENAPPPATKGRGAKAAGTKGGKTAAPKKPAAAAKSRRKKAAASSDEDDDEEEEEEEEVEEEDEEAEEAPKPKARKAAAAPAAKGKKAAAAPAAATKGRKKKVVDSDDDE